MALNPTTLTAASSKAKEVATLADVPTHTSNTIAPVSTTEPIGSTYENTTDNSLWTFTNNNPGVQNGWVQGGDPDALTDANFNTNITTIDGGKITTGTVSSAQITSGAITSNHIAANTITAADIAAGTITATQISSGYIYAGTLVADNITTGTLNVDRIVSGSLTSTSTGSFSRTVGATTSVLLASVSLTVGTVSTVYVTMTQGALGTVLKRNGVTVATANTAGTLVYVDTSGAAATYTLYSGSDPWLEGYYSNNVGSLSAVIHKR